MEKLDILYLENSKILIETIKELLGKEGIEFSLTIAENREEFIDKIKNNSYSLILSSYKLKDINIFDVYKLVTEIENAVPIICISEQLPEEELIIILKTGVNDFVCTQRLARLPLIIQRTISEFNEKRELNKLKAELLESYDAFKFFFDNSMIGKSMTYLNGTININKAFANMLGYTMEELKNKRWQDITHPDDIKPNSLIVEKLVKGELESARFVKRYIHKNGNIIWADVSTCLRRDRHGNPLYFLTNVLDITARIKFEEEQNKARERAEELNRAKSNFFSNMSHELRTPLIGILGFAEILSEHPKADPEIQKMSKTIYSSGARLLDTLNKILQISRIESERIEVIPEQLNIIPILEKAISNQMYYADKLKIKIKTKFESDNIICSIDKNLIFEVFNNLINNQIKFSDGSDVIIEAKIENGKAVINFIDFGVGIPNDKKDIIWLPFRQASEGLNRHFEGTGLGLTIAKKFTEAMGGKISMVSEEGVGSTFTVEFPIAKSEKIEEKEIIIPAKEKPEPVSDLKKLLYIEDDEVAIMLINRILKDKYLVENAMTDKVALEKLKNNTYDGILMDINLNKSMNGIQLSKIIRSMPKYEKVPIIAITAYARPSDKEEFLKAGMSYYLAKPFTKSELITFLNNIFY